MTLATKIGSELPTNLKTEGNEYSMLVKTLNLLEKLNAFPREV